MKNYMGCKWNIYSWLLFSFLIVCPTILFSQNYIQKIGDEICDCLEKQQGSLNKSISNCWSISEKNMTVIYKYNGTDRIEDINFEKLGIDVNDYLSKKCSYYDKYSLESELDENFNSEESLKCSDFKKGDFYYIYENFEKQKKDTVFVTTKNEMFLERMQGGKTYTFSNIKWKSDCRFQLEFKNSNDGLQNINNSSGEISNCLILNTTSNSFFIELNRKKETKQIEFFKLEN